MFALAELARDIGRADERVEVSAIGVRETTERFEQLRRLALSFSSVTSSESHAWRSPPSSSALRSAAIAPALSAR